MTEAERTWDGAIERFRETANTDAGRGYLMLLEGARSRWETVIAVHPWRLDVLDLTARNGTPGQSVQAEYRVRDGQPIVIFRLGHAGSVRPTPTTTGDICGLETAPSVLDAFLLQIAEPGA